MFNLSCCVLRGGVYEVITLFMMGMIRRMHFRDGKPVRKIVRRTGLSRNTVRDGLRAPACWRGLLRLRGVGIAKCAAESNHEVMGQHALHDLLASRSRGQQIPDLSLHLLGIHSCR